MDSMEHTDEIEFTFQDSQRHVVPLPPRTLVTNFHFESNPVQRTWQNASLVQK